MSALSNHQAFADAMPLTYKPGQHAPDMNALVRKHAALVRRIAWHVHGGMSAAIDIEDLIQTGLVALVEAAGERLEGDGVAADHGEIDGDLLAGFHGQQTPRVQFQPCLQEQFTGRRR